MRPVEEYYVFLIELASAITAITMSGVQVEKNSLH